MCLRLCPCCKGNGSPCYMEHKARVYSQICTNISRYLHIYMHIYLPIYLYLECSLQSFLVSFPTSPLPALALYRVWQSQAQLLAHTRLLRICRGRYKGREGGRRMLGVMGDGLPKQSAAINDKLDQQCQRQRERNCHTQSERDPQYHGTAHK